RKEIEALEGPDGPVGLAADVAAGLAVTIPGDTGRIAALREKLKAATEKRESWPRLFALAGDLDQLDGQPEAALEAYRKALDLGDRSAAVVRKITRLLLDRGLQADALALLGRFEKDGTLAPDLAQQLGMLRTMAGEDTARGLAWAESAAGKGSKNTRDHLFRAMLFVLADRRADAEAALRTAVSLDPTAPEGWVALVRFLVAAGRAADARTAFEQAAAKLPTTGAVVPVALGTCLELLGDPKAAEQQFRTAVGRFPADPTAVRPLVAFLTRTGRRAEAEILLRGVADAPGVAPAARRWARRTLALAIAESPSGFGRLRQAHDLLDINLKDGNYPDDQRARAVLAAADPFRRAEAIELLAAAAAKTPLNPEENVLLARLYLRGGRADLAAEGLREATRATNVAAPEYLGLLVRVELQRGNPSGAKAALDRLAAVAPRSWEAVSADARYLAKTKDKAAVVARIRAWPGVDDPGAAVALVGPLFDELGMPAEAEAAYRTFLKKQPGPVAHAPLAGFLLKSGRAADALALAREYQATAPPGLTARLKSGAIRVRPPSLLPAADRPAWEKEAAAVTAWVDGKRAADPMNPDLLFARAELFDAAGKTADEIAVYETALKAFPENELFLNNLAVLLALAGNDKSGRPLELVNHAIARSGPRQHLLDSRATIHRAAGRPKDALDDLEVALAVEPRSVYQFHAAQAWDKLGETQKRDSAVADAVKGGLTKAMLNPLEWPAFDALTAGKPQRRSWPAAAGS
ncbi:MAG: tetratricopeptide repeat protein, partial [Fimbriiglobus sp.]